MSWEISLLLRINSLFRILGNFQKSIGSYCRLWPRRPQIGLAIWEVPYIFPVDQGIRTPGRRIDRALGSIEEGAFRIRLPVQALTLEEDGSALSAHQNQAQPKAHDQR